GHQYGIQVGAGGIDGSAVAGRTGTQSQYFGVVGSRHYRKAEKSEDPIIMSPWLDYLQHPHAPRAPRATEPPPYRRGCPVCVAKHAGSSLPRWLPGWAWCWPLGIRPIPPGRIPCMPPPP